MFVCKYEMNYRSITFGIFTYIIFITYYITF